MLFNLSDHNSIANEFLFELRDKNIQKDRMRFRRNIERIGEILAYEISKDLGYTEHVVATPIATSSINRIEKMPVLVTILRAGLPLAQGFLNFFDQADLGFVGAFRQEGQEVLEIKMTYVASPSVVGRNVIIADPMLASGESIVKTVENLFQNGAPGKVHVAAVIAAPEGVRRVSEYFRNLGMNFKLYIGALDKELDRNFYIVPGLGDAGDLSFGIK